MKFFLSLIFTFSFLVSCQTKDGSRYYDLKKEYKEFINSNEKDINKLIANADKIKSNLSNYLTDFPKSEYFNEISELNETFENIIEEKSYKTLISNIDSLKTKKFADYASKQRKIEELTANSNFLILRLKNKIYIDKINGIFYILKKHKINNENEKNEYIKITESYKTDYSKTDADFEIKKINNFFINFPGTIKKEEFLKRIDKLLFLKLELQSKIKIKDIQTLNAVIDTCNIYNNEIISLEIKNNSTKVIEQLQNSRKKIFNIEFKSKQKSVGDSMIIIAKKFINSEVHEFCKKIISSKLTNKEQKEYTNKTILTNTYKFQSKCGFGCSKICETIIIVTATLSGDEKSGISYESNAELVSDEKKD